MEQHEELTAAKARERITCCLFFGGGRAGWAAAEQQQGKQKKKELCVTTVNIRQKARDWPSRFESTALND